MSEVVEKNMFLETVKWIGTACVIVAATCRAFEFHTVDLILSIFGAALWGYAAYKMQDKPLMVVNGFITGILLVGVFK
jgi:hypothetical protein